MDKYEKKLMDEYEEIQIAGTRVFVPPPTVIPDEPFVGRKDLIEKTLAAWSTIDGDKPQHFRLYGPPGTGKNALVYELARILKIQLYMIQGRDDFRVEDLAIVPVLDPKDTTTAYYVASPLFAAMYRGGIAFFDEIAKAPSGALTTLASVLDERETLESTMAPVKIKAEPGFLFCAALNANEETGIGLEEYLKERTSPAIYVGNPSMKELGMIIKSQIQGNSGIWIKEFVSLFKDSNLSPRLAVKLIVNAIKLYKHIECKQTSLELRKTKVHKYLKKAAEGFPVEMPEKELSPKRKPISKKERGTNVYNLVSKSKSGSIH